MSFRQPRFTPPVATGGEIKENSVSYNEETGVVERGLMSTSKKLIPTEAFTLAIRKKTGEGLEETNTKILSGSLAQDYVNEIMNDK